MFSNNEILLSIALVTKHIMKQTNRYGIVVYYFTVGAILTIHSNKTYHFSYNW